MTEVAVTVRALALFCHRRGDIDHRFTAAPTGVQGIEGHQRLYRRRPASYQPEFAVAWEGDCEGLALRLRGRADGYDRERELVEEIKTCRVDPATIPEAVSHLHLAQGRLYAALIAAAEDLAELTVQLTWLQLDRDEEHCLQQRYSRAQLDAFLQQSLQCYCRWLIRVRERCALRDRSLAQLPFPHRGFRPGQREIAERVYKCIHQAGRLLVEAPTGIGKTAAVLYPAVKALATGRHERLVFATSKITGRRAAEQTLALLADSGYAGSALTLTAKEQICLAPGKACHGEDCPYARGYYDKLPAALEAALAEPLLDREAVQALARRLELCPYQLSLDLVPWVDVIVADVHHLFSLTPNLAQRLEEDVARWTVLLDEAHCLPSRARQMYSAQLDKAALMAARREAPAAVRTALTALNRALLTLQKTTLQHPGEHWQDTVPEQLVLGLQRVVEQVGEAQAADALALQRRPALRDWYFAVLQFLRVLDDWGEEFRLELCRDDRPQSLRLQLHCLDPARLLGQRQAGLHALVAFSATLSPQHWALAGLGLDHSAVAYCAPSPFAPQQLEVSLATHIDTRYQQRRNSLPQLAALLRHWLQREPGNCLLYFPSYQYLRDCLDELERQGWPEGRHCWRQAAEQDTAARDALLQLLQQRRDVAAFCILGGAFGEGIDLPGEALCSVVVVGVGLPQVNTGNEKLRAWYQQRLGDGFAFAYLYPGMQKVSQALGRVVRRDSDHGRALLVDGRYADPGCRALLPPWWDYRDYCAEGD